jgi:hypothetical protein
MRIRSGASGRRGEAMGGRIRVVEPNLKYANIWTPFLTGGKSTAQQPNPSPSMLHTRPPPPPIDWIPTDGGLASCAGLVGGLAPNRSEKRQRSMIQSAARAAQRRWEWLEMDLDRIRVETDSNVTIYHILIRIRIWIRILSDTNTKRIVRIRIYIRILTWFRT